MKVILFLRRVQDWENDSLEDMVFTDELPAPHDTVRTWNNTFAIDYFDFRSKLQKISFDNWSHLNAEVQIKELHDIQDDDWIVPTDDDDWFHPDLPDHLLSVDSDVVYWNCLVHQIAYSTDLSQWHDFHEEFCTNNYAIRGKYLKLLGFERLFSLLDRHWEVLKLMEAEKPRVQKLEQTLSCYNRHFGGISTLAHCRNDSSKLLSFVPKKSFEIPEEYSWVQEYSDRMFELIWSLGLKFRLYL